MLIVSYFGRVFLKDKKGNLLLLLMLLISLARSSPPFSSPFLGLFQCLLSPLIFLLFECCTVLIPFLPISPCLFPHLQFTSVHDHHPSSSVSFPHSSFSVQLVPVFSQSCQEVWGVSEHVHEQQLVRPSKSSLSSFLADFWPTSAFSEHKKVHLTHVLERCSVIKDEEMTQLSQRYKVSKPFYPVCHSYSSPPLSLYFFRGLDKDSGHESGQQ